MCKLFTIRHITDNAIQLSNMVVEMVGEAFFWLVLYIDVQAKQYPGAPFRVSYSVSGAASFARPHGDHV